MELELTFPQKSRLSIIVLGSILVLFLAFGWVGKWVTPTPPRILTWEEWQVLKSQRQYQLEHRRLQILADSLVLLLENEPEPVRAQLLSESIQRQVGLPSLDFQRQLLNDAAQEVRDWAMGAVEKEQARSAVEQALESLSTQESKP